jgi:hypothetical protein
MRTRIPRRCKTNVIYVVKPFTDRFEPARTFGKSAHSLLTVD